MFATLSRTALAAVLGAGFALTTASAVAAAPQTAAAPVFSVTATNLTYGQPDLNGTRSGTNTVTITNNGGSTLAPMLTFPVNSRDALDQSGLPDCPSGSQTPERFICYARPLGAGETRTLSFGWVTAERGPAGRTTVRVASAAADGTPAPGTTSRASYRVGFAPLTGTFDITATDLTYGPADADGVRHGSTRVRITNLSGKTVDFPLVSFAPYAGDADVASWKSCLSVYDRDSRKVCAVRPLAPGERRTLTFGFRLDFPTTEFDSQVQVEAGAAVDGPALPGTAAGTSYTVR